MPTSRRDALRGRLAQSPVRSTGVSPSSLRVRDRLGARRLDGVANGQRRRAARRPTRPRRRRHARPTSTACPSTVPTTPTPATFRNSSTAGKLADLAPRGRRRPPCAIGCSDAASTAPARRSTSAPRRAVERADLGERHPPLGDGARLVEHDRRDPPRPLEHLGALDEDPELRAAPGSDHAARSASRGRARTGTR